MSKKQPNKGTVKFMRFIDSGISLQENIEAAVSTYREGFANHSQNNLSLRVNKRLLKQNPEVKGGPVKVKGKKGVSPHFIEVMVDD